MSAQTKHTPGPWHGKQANGRYDHSRNAWEVDNEDCVCSEWAPICGEDGTVVALVVHAQDEFYLGSNPIIDGNAALVAAAPEFLDFAQRIGAAYSNDPGTSDLYDEQPVTITLGDVRRARRLIAKATGESP